MSNALFTLAQSSSSGGGAAGVAGAIGFLLFLAIYLGIIVLLIAGLWKVFTKAGQPGWAAIIPIYNIYILCTIVGRPGWWTILMFVPFVSIIFAIILMLDLAKAFGKSTGFAVGLILLGIVFIPILGFGSSQYQGPPARA